MPTLNQLVKKSRSKAKKKSKAIALTRGFNVLQNRPVFYDSPFKKGVCTKVTTKTPSGGSSSTESGG
jgi:small subunit ribosomal protein S12